MSITQPATGPAHWPEARVVALEGGRNFRDLGGYPAADGRHVRWGLIFRSGSLAKLTAADWDHLAERGVRTLCDFRSTRERDAEPFAWADRERVSYWTRDYETSFADLHVTLRSGFATADAARDAMMAGYRNLPYDQAPAYRRLFEHLRDGDLPLVFNCSAGKDRAGTAAALILSALGVPREVVLEDFLLTNDVGGLKDMGKGRDPSSTLGRQSDAVVDAVLRADADYITAALAAIETRNGSIEGYLSQELGIDEPALATLRDTLLT